MEGAENGAGCIILFRTENADAVGAAEINREVYYMGNEKIYQMDFSKVYGLLVQKAERKGRTRQEVDELARGKDMDKSIKEY